jgi:hypothetical protein
MYDEKRNRLPKKIEDTVKSLLLDYNIFHEFEKPQENYDPYNRNPFDRSQHSHTDTVAWTKNYSR